MKQFLFIFSICFQFISLFTILPCNCTLPAGFAFFLSDIYPSLSANLLVILSVFLHSKGLHCPELLSSHVFDFAGLG